jgi:hypothetical protein
MTFCTVTDLGKNSSRDHHPPPTCRSKDYDLYKAYTTRPILLLIADLLNRLNILQNDEILVPKSGRIVRGE